MMITTYVSLQSNLRQRSLSGTSLSSWTLLCLLSVCVYWPTRRRRRVSQTLHPGPRGSAWFRRAARRTKQTSVQKTRGPQSSSVSQRQDDGACESTVVDGSQKFQREARTEYVTASW